MSNFTVMQWFNTSRIYHWSGLDSSGILMQGWRKEDSKAKLHQWMLSSNIQPVSMQATTRCGQLSAKSIPALFKQFAALLSVQAPMADIFLLVGKKSSKDTSSVLKQMANDLQEGVNFSECIRPYLPADLKFLSRIIHVGESSGCLDEVLEKLADQLERKQAIQKKLTSAMIYPITIVIFSLITMGFLIYGVVPQFESFYSSFGEELPIYTKITVYVSNTLVEYALPIFAGVATILIGLVAAYNKSRSLRLLLAKTVLRLPIIGHVRRMSVNHSCSNLLAISYGAEVPLDKAVQWLADATNNLAFRQALLQCSERLDSGVPFHAAIGEQDIFDDFFKQMVDIGENSGKLEQMFKYCAEYYEGELHSSSQRIVLFMQPAMLMIAAAIVGWIICTLYLPIFQLGFAL